MIFILAFDSESDRDKFEYIYSKYKKLMLKKAYDILKDYMLAEDAVSEAFLRIYKNIKKIDNPEDGRAAAFVMTIVKNTALTLLRNNDKSNMEELGDAISDGFDLERFVLSEISSENIYAVINGINDELRDVFILKFAYGMDHKSIGGLLGISENNVTVRLFRAKKKISEMLFKEGYVRGI